MELKELYQEIILDHGKNPRNKGKCDGYSHNAQAHNPLCGDKVHVFLKLDGEKKVMDISFEGEGCAISLASASILTETLKGKDLAFTKKVSEDFLKMVKNKTNEIIYHVLMQHINHYQEVKKISILLIILFSSHLFVDENLRDFMKIILI